MISIIIPSFNNLNYLKLCINSLKKNSYYKNEILVHVNEGKDGTKDYLDANNVIYTYSKDNIGLCSACNLISKKVDSIIFYIHTMICIFFLTGTES